MRQRVPLKNYWMIPLLGVAVAIGLNNILLFLDLAKYSKAYQEAAEALYAPPFVQQILYTGILVPIIEELVFRGAIFKVLRKWIPFVWAMLVSAFLFGIYHGNLVQFVYASICGFLLAYVCEVYGSLLAPILAHMIMNLVVCTMSEFGGFTWIFEGTARAIVVTAGCIAITVLLLLHVRKLDKR